MACAFKENSCQVGIIVGTGTNACYMEKISRCEKLADEHLENDGFPDEVGLLTHSFSAKNVVLLFFSLPRFIPFSLLLLPFSPFSSLSLSPPPLLFSLSALEFFCDLSNEEFSG